MPLREDILNPLAGDGTDLRYSPVYDQIKEARREDDELAQGAWLHERKVANHAAAITLAEEVIATKSKDLQLAAWLTGSLLKVRGLSGLLEGLTLCTRLVEIFWDTLYPQIEDGDAELRAAPLEWIGSSLDIDVKKVSLTRDGYNFLQHKDSRAIVYDDQTKTKEQKAVREAALKGGKLAPETFDRSFGETPKLFYFETEKILDSCLVALSTLDRVCQEKFGDAAPSFRKLRSALEDVRHVVHALLEKKREFDPDPVEEAPSVTAAPETAGSPLVVIATPNAATFEIGDSSGPLAAVSAAAQHLRRRDPYSPAPYLMLRGLRWGELRASSDPAVLEGPPIEVRRQIKSLALNNRWTDLLEAAESVMGLPCGRAWLDLQRLVVEACVALGKDYEAIAIAIRSELRALLSDLPQLLDTTLSDETPAANPETRAWLCELLAEERPIAAPDDPNVPHLPDMSASKAAGWHKKFIDPHALALDAVRKGQPLKGMGVLQDELEKQHSGRGRFQRKLQLAQISVAAGQSAIAQPLLDDIAAAIENHKLEEWEDRETVAGALAFLLQNSKKIQNDAKVKQTMFERICRLDAVQALSV
jgi:type VI secretion system protein ImpA